MTALLGWSDVFGCFTPSLELLVMEDWNKKAVCVCVHNSLSSRSSLSGIAGNASLRTALQQSFTNQAQYMANIQHLDQQGSYIIRKRGTATV